MSTEQYHAPQEDQQYNRPATPNDLPPGGYREPGRKEKSRGRKILERSVAGTVLASVLGGGGVYIGVKATQHDAPAPTNPNRPTSSAPAVPGSVDPSQATPVKDIDPNDVVIATFTPHLIPGTDRFAFTKAESPINPFVAANQLHDPNPLATNPTIDTLLNKELNVIGSISATDSSYAAPERDGELKRGDVTLAAEELLLPTTADPGNIANLDIVPTMDPSLDQSADPSVHLVPGGLGKMINDNMVNGTVDRFTNISDTERQEGPISGTRFKTADVSMLDEKINISTGEETSSKTLKEIVQYNVDPNTHIASIVGVTPES